MTLFDFSQTITKLNKEKNFSDALSYFKENKSQFTTDQIVSNDYLIAAMVTALRQTANFDNAFKFLDIYQIKIDENTREIILTAYGWLLYSKFKSENKISEYSSTEAESFEDEEIETATGHHYNKSEIIQKIEASIPLFLTVKSDFTYSVVSNLFNSVLKAEKKKANASWKFVSDFCDLISPDYLSLDCRTIEVERKGQKKPMEMASDRENWFAYKSKALMKLGKYQECYEISKTALDSFEKFHYSNDVWFARRIALSKKNLGNPADAIEELQQILRRKREWFIQKELADLCREGGDLERSFDYAIAAINNFGDLEYKVDLLFLLGDLLSERNENDLAFKHFSLSRLLRVNSGWKIPEKLSLILSQFKQEPIPSDKCQELKNELMKYWKSFLPKDTENRSGTGIIKGILHDNEQGMDGFIDCDHGGSVYFSVNSHDVNKNVYRIGTKVKFIILPAIEGKKDRATKLKLIY